MNTQERIAAIETELAALKASLTAEQESDWPKVGDKYCAITMVGEMMSLTLTANTSETCSKLNKKLKQSYTLVR